MQLKDFISQNLPKLIPLYAEEEAKALLHWLLEERTGEKHGHEALLLSGPVQDQLLRDVEALAQARPIQQVLGKAYFLDMELFVNEHVLIPRPETEELVDLVRKAFPENAEIKLADIGTGSGCIALGLARYFKAARVEALDHSAEALEVARYNAAKYALPVHFFKGNVLSAWPLVQEVEVMVSNPPYITPGEKETMHRNVLAYEPHEALFVPEEDPLLFYKAICAHAQKHLVREGKVFLEVNRELAKDTLKVFEKVGFTGEVYKDMQGNDRFVVATKK